MKRVLILLLLAVASGSALAGGWHGHSRVVVGFNFGYPGWYAPYYYPPPAYYYPPAYYPYVAPATPTTYVERSDMAEEAPAQPPATWYFCREANGYYPYVKQCPGGWMRVPAQPPN
jgi:hypothetical protein